MKRTTIARWWPEHWQVLNCPCAKPDRAHAFTSHTTAMAHVDAHASLSLKVSRLLNRLRDMANRQAEKHGLPPNLLPQEAPAWAKVSTAMRAEQTLPSAIDISALILHSGDIQFLDKEN